MRLLVPAAVVCFVFAGCTTTTEELPPDAFGGEASPADFGAHGDPFLGNASAPVQVVAFDAPGCSNCKRYHDTRFDDVKADFIDTGKIGYHAVQWLVYPSYDTDAGVALECVFRAAGDEAYFDMVGRFFADLLRADARELAQETATDHGADVGTVLMCYDDRETLAEVEADVQAGKDSGAGSNPGFAVIHAGGVTLVKGTAGPYAAIAEALA